MGCGADVLYLDATFYADGEIPGRDMTGFPHPFITHTMKRLAALPQALRGRVRQLIEQSTDEGQTYTVWFDGYYARSGS
ncbi:MAG: hypothetical protein KatS3mg044_0862 [Rhodothermaceae bacterium]|nr:MAG: hypothetical protein KatS3mg044_0862 [Rhodothermaceae bacterium]